MCAIKQSETTRVWNAGGGGEGVEGAYPGQQAAAEGGQEHRAERQHNGSGGGASRPGLGHRQPQAELRGSGKPGKVDLGGHSPSRGQVAGWTRPPP